MSAKMMHEAYKAVGGQTLLQDGGTRTEHPRVEPLEEEKDRRLRGVYGVDRFVAGVKGEVNCRIWGGGGRGGLSKSVLPGESSKSLSSPVLRLDRNLEIVGGLRELSWETDESRHDHMSAPEFALQPTPLYGVCSCPNCASNVIRYKESHCHQSQCYLLTHSPIAPIPPSTTISNALGSFAKAVNLTLSTIDEQAKVDVARANTERDDASFHSMQLAKSDLTVKHQAQTISQLQSEIQQWKNQLMRLEESSRQEILSWRDQYVRAEQERCKMSSRIDELVAKQLDWNTQANGTKPYTPKPTSSAVTMHASSSAHSLPALPTHKRLIPHARVPEDPQFAHLASRKTRSQLRQQVIRRVKIVIEVPMKEEDKDDHVLEAEESSASSSAYDPDDTPVRPVGRELEEDDDDVDELVMGSENPRKVHPTQEPVTPSAKRRGLRAARPTGSGKKRKLDADSGGPSDRGTSTKHDPKSLIHDDPMVHIPVEYILCPNKNASNKLISMIHLKHRGAKRVFIFEHTIRAANLDHQNRGPVERVRCAAEHTDPQRKCVALRAVASL
ncbi:hypothetical protein A0H81_14996 [Grifola frondosa]|uniref:Uncharacterized protein n=1 Tax=Grifola frondosa TaxID=5627 RepID=A0A1C7LM87_GRIFR|nr:hypothetical protein A0H81_14996 [Grifola frondosa]